MSGLSFFHPEFFWALAALSIPLIIHLLNRRPPRRLEFSTLRFFSAGAVRKSKVRALKRVLLLLVRLCIILSVVAIFLQPFNRHDPFASLWNPDAAVYAFVDPTVSMDYRGHDGPLWQEAFAALDSLDKMLSPSAKRWFYDDARRAFVSQRAFPIPPRVFSRHGPSGSSRMMAAFGETWRVRGRGAGLPILIALSDFQESESRAFDTAFTRRAGAPVACVSVAPKDAWDYRVSDVRVASENVSTVNARIACVGRNLRTAPLSVIIGGMRAGHMSVTLDKGQQSDISIPVTADASGQPAGTVLCEADDPFPLDNTGYFVRGTSRTVRVLIAGDTYESFPLAAAFESLGPTQWNVAAKKENEVTYGDIDSAALIVLCGVRRLSSPLDLLVHGRSFGPKAVLFSPVTDSAGAYVNNAVLSAVRRQSLSLVAEGTVPHSPVLSDTLSALFAGFPRLRDADARVYRYCEGLPGAVAVRLDNGIPLLTILDDTLGNSWIMAATPLGLSPRGQPAANNLSETGLFVALLDRMCRHALSAIHREPHAWTAGCAARNPYLGSKGGALVFDLQNRLVATWLRQPSVVFDEPGCYRIQPHGEQAYWVAVQTDSSETSLSYRFPEAGKDNADLVRCMTADRFIDFVKSSRHGAFPFWLWVCLGLLLVAEVLLWERNRPPVAVRM